MATPADAKRRSGPTRTFENIHQTYPKTHLKKCLNTWRHEHNFHSQASIKNLQVEITEFLNYMVPKYIWRIGMREEGALLATKNVPALTSLQHNRRKPHHVRQPFLSTHNSHKQMTQTTRGKTYIGNMKHKKNRNPPRRSVSTPADGKVSYGLLTGAKLERRRAIQKTVPPPLMRSRCIPRSPRAIARIGILYETPRQDETDQHEVRR